jgi:glycosyltransferase involved in cell wall biosynthesis
MTVVHSGIADSPERARPARATSSRIAMVARFSVFNDHEVLVRAFAQVDSSARLLLIGDGPTRRDTERLVAELGIAERVEFTGDRDDVARLLSGVDIFVLASRNDHLPISILEAMRAGLPVIATRVGGIPELVAPGVTGFLVEPRSIEEMTRALSDLIANKPLRGSMGRAGRARYERLFSFRRMMERTRAVYGDVLNERRSRERVIACPPAFQSGHEMSSPKP